MKTGTWIIVIIGAFIVVAAFSTAGKKPAKDTSSKFDAWIMAQTFVEQRLTSPSTASYGSIGEQSSTQNVRDLGNSRYQVHGFVDAENGFGGTVRMYFKVILKYVGKNKWKIEGELDLREN